jgi:hypothetical protein
VPGVVNREQARSHTTDSGPLGRFGFVGASLLAMRTLSIPGLDARMEWEQAQNNDAPRYNTGRQRYNDGEQ